MVNSMIVSIGIIIMFPQLFEFIYRIHERLFGFPISKNGIEATKNGRKYYLCNLILMSLFAFLFVSLLVLKVASVGTVAVVLTAITGTYGLYVNGNVRSKETTSRNGAGSGDSVSPPPWL